MKRFTEQYSLLYASPVEGGNGGSLSHFYKAALIGQFYWSEQTTPSRLHQLSYFHLNSKTTGRCIKIQESIHVQDESSKFSSDTKSGGEELLC